MHLVGRMDPFMESLDTCQGLARKTHVSELKPIRKNAGTCSAKQQRKAVLFRKKDKHERDAERRVTAYCEHVGNERAIVFHRRRDLGS